MRAYNVVDIFLPNFTFALKLLSSRPKLGLIMSATFSYRQNFSVIALPNPGGSFILAEMSVIVAEKDWVLYSGRIQF